MPNLSILIVALSSPTFQSCSYHSTKAGTHMCATMVTRLFYRGKLPNNLTTSGSSATIFQSARLLLAAQTEHFSLLAVDIHNSTLNSTTKTHQRGYSPYGYWPLESFLCPTLGFNGHLLWPLSKLYSLGNGYRTYAPALMRFLSPDSSSPFERGGINAYSYCSGDPINHTDPSGHMKSTAWADKITADTLSALTAKQQKQDPRRQKSLHYQRQNLNTEPMSHDYYEWAPKEVIQHINNGKEKIKNLLNTPETPSRENFIDLISIGIQIVAHEHYLPTSKAIGTHGGGDSAYFKYITESAQEVRRLADNDDKSVNAATNT